MGPFPDPVQTHHLSLTQIGLRGALYPAFWSIAQLGTGALSDRIGRKWLISTGMLVKAGALALVASSTRYAPWIVAAVLLGLGTSMVYPTLLAGIGDVAHPIWRPGRLVSTGSRAMPGSPPARCSRVLSPNCGASRPRIGSWPRSPPGPD
jgi:MFS family permease